MEEIFPSFDSESAEAAPTGMTWENPDGIRDPATETNMGPDGRPAMSAIFADGELNPEDAVRLAAHQAAAEASEPVAVPAAEDVADSRLTRPRSDAAGIQWLAQSASPPSEPSDAAAGDGASDVRVAEPEETSRSGGPDGVASAKHHPTPTPDDVADKNSGPSEAQIQANRANAKKSTGPRTTAGKVKSSANSLKHGAYAKRLEPIVGGPFHEGTDFGEFMTEVIDALAPTNALQRATASEIALLLWKEKRLALWEARQLQIAVDESEPTLDEQIADQAVERQLDDVTAWCQEWIALDGAAARTFAAPSAPRQSTAQASEPDQTADSTPPAEDAPAQWAPTLSWQAMAYYLRQHRVGSDAVAGVWDARTQPRTEGEWESAFKTMATLYFQGAHAMSEWAAGQRLRLLESQERRRWANELRLTDRSYDVADRYAALRARLNSEKVRLLGVYAVLKAGVRAKRT